MSEDWRALAAGHIKGQKLQRRKWEAWSKQWNFDHCQGCNAVFADLPDHPGYPAFLREGYTTTGEYEYGAGHKWICRTCFIELKDEMGWIEVPPDSNPIVSPDPDAIHEQMLPGGKLIGKD